MWTIAKMTFKEMFYKKIFVITLIMSILFLIFYGVASYLAIDKAKEGYDIFSTNDMQNTFIANQFLGMGLYFSSFIISLFAILSSVGSISTEIENHQIDTLLVRPLTRISLVLGKFIGLSLLLILYSLVLYFGVIIINQTLGGDILKVSLEAIQIIKALGVYLLQPLVLVAMSLLFSSFMTTINSGVIMIVLYGIGFIGGFIEQLGAMFNNVSLTNLGIVSSLIFPIDSLFRRMIIFLLDTVDNPISFATQGMFGSMSAPNNLMLGYTILYMAVALILTARNFVRRDI
jgi:ABC-type transport system involved in multi-copper enzyme maturation permease subunit